MKLRLLLITLLFPLTAWSQGASHYKDSYGTMVNMQQLPAKQLLDTAEYYYAKGRIDTALVYYNMITNASVRDGDMEQMKIAVDAYNKAAVAYYNMGHYRNAYELLINALSISEKCDYAKYEPLIYTNLGNIYYRFNERAEAKAYYMKALGPHTDSVSLVALYNNLGELEIESGRTDSAFHYLNKALHISERKGDVYKYNILNAFALLYQKERNYDSAYGYYRLAMTEAYKENSPESEAGNLSNFGRFWFERNQLDSARLYIESSNAIAVENNFLPTLTDNYLLLSEIERSKGNSDGVLEYYEKYAALKDSMLNTKNFGEINQLQRLYEVSKINRRIEQLTVERQLREQTIHYHRIIQVITLAVLLSVCIVLLVVFRQKRKLNKAYKTLFEKNIEIIDFRGSQARNKQPEKHKKQPSPQEQDSLDDLWNRILAVMEETSVICDPKFSINVLAGQVQANHQYVSQVINTTFGKNFRTFLNSYRIREAQRLFADPDSVRYTIESVALSVGFRSRTTFREAFKEVTGISPTFYINSMRESR